MQYNVSLCNGDSGNNHLKSFNVDISMISHFRKPAGRRGKNFNLGYILLNIRGRLLIFGIHIDHMDLYPPDL